MIEIFTGPMKSKKSGSMIREVIELEKHGKKVICIKPQIDNRFGEEQIKSRTGLTHPAFNSDLSLSNLKLEELLSFDVIAFDEAQFFHHEIVDIVRELDLHDKLILIAGLNLDYTGKPMGHMGHLVLMADIVHLCTAFCAVCKEEAKYTQRLTSDKNIILVGDSEYSPRCKKHFSGENPT